MESKLTPKEKAKELIEMCRNLELAIGGEFDGYLHPQLWDAIYIASLIAKELQKVEKQYETEEESIKRGNELTYFEEVEAEIVNYPHQ